MNTSNIKTSIKERLAFAYQVIGGIPEKVIDLERYRSKEGKTLDCGTICCGAGWLALHPVFNELGLTLSASNFPQTEKTMQDYQNDPEDALAEIFGTNAFDKYFSPRYLGKWDSELVTQFRNANIRPPTDKELLLARLKKGYHLSRFSPRTK